MSAPMERRKLFWSLVTVFALAAAAVCLRRTYEVSSWAHCVYCRQPLEFREGTLVTNAWGEFLGYSCDDCESRGKTRKGK